jgi:hypothetical protein
MNVGSLGIAPGKRANRTSAPATVSMSGKAYQLAAWPSHGLRCIQSFDQAGSVRKN